MEAVVASLELCVDHCGINHRYIGTSSGWQTAHAPRVRCTRRRNGMRALACSRPPWLLGTWRTCEKAYPLVSSL